MKEGIKRNTSWQNVHSWYSNKVGDKGHHFQESIIFPRVLDLFELNENSKVLDLGCGDGVFSRYLEKFNRYLGVDLSKDLIKTATTKNSNENIEFKVADVSRKLDIPHDFTHSLIALALQNIEDYEVVFKNAYDSLKVGGILCIVLNHPSFRIPKSSSWEVDTQTSHQYRRIFRYLSPHKIRIDMTPGEVQNKEFTYSFHRSLQDYSLGLFNNGFRIERIYEWASDRESNGKYAESENFARNEIPMFMCILAKKII